MIGDHPADNGESTLKGDGPSSAHQVMNECAQDDFGDKRIEYLWRTYDTVNEWIKFSDTKAQVTLAVDGVIGGIVLSAVAGNASILPRHSYAPWLLALLVIGTGVSVWFSICCLVPVLKITTARTLIYFGDIAQFKTAQAYSSAMAQIPLDGQVLESGLSGQIWANSKIALGKFRMVRLSTYSLAASVIFGLLFVLATVIPV